MKKLLSLLLVLTLVLSMGMVAFAEPDPVPSVYNDSPTVTINKALTATPTGSNPAETFNFEVGEGSYVRDTETGIAPAFGNDSMFTINVAKGGTSGTTSITNVSLDSFTKVGVYTYPITEVEGDTAGMAYDGATYNLVITVINNPDYGVEGDTRKFLRVLTLTTPNNVKTDSFDNTFNAGSLTIKKETAGNYADPDDTFEVTVTLEAVNGKTLKNEMITSVNADSTTVVDGGTGNVTITYTVKKGSTFTINNIPYDVKYTVAEAVDKGYTATYVGETGIIGANNASPTATITNTRNTGIATGITLDNIPYIILLAGAAIGIVALMVRRRKNMEF